MLSLYEILKASKTGIAPDMWTALAGMNWGGADSGHEVKELTGIPPLSFTADGTPLLDYLISGNMSQTGTPTPDNPIMPNGVGERTGNLWGYTIEQGGWSAAAGTVPVKAVPYDASYARRCRVSEIVAIPNRTLSLSCSSDIKINYVWVDVNGYSLGGSGFQTNGDTATAPENAVSMTFILAKNDDSYCTPSNFTNIMLVAGDTPLPYQPYGYKIPISSGGVTTNIYLGSTQTVRQIKKLVLDGTENWTLSSYPNTFYTADFTDYLRELDTNLSLCSHYRTIEQVQGASFITDGVLSWFGRINASRLYIGDVRFSTAAELQTYLAQQYAAGTPIVVWYVLTTPETATVNEPLMKIGDYADTLSMEQAGVQIPTLHGNTVIDIETTPKPSQMYIKYQQ